MKQNGKNLYGHLMDVQEVWEPKVKTITEQSWGTVAEQRLEENIHVTKDVEHAQHLEI